MHQPFIAHLSAFGRIAPYLGFAAILVGGVVLIISSLTRLPQLAHLGEVNRLIFLCQGAKGRHYRATFGPALLGRSLGVADPAGTASIAG
jgi:hypothetical protein